MFLLLDFNGEKNIMYAVLYGGAWDNVPYSI